MTRRVVVTGLGTVNPLGHTVPDYWAALLAGRSGVAPIKLFDTSAFKVHFAGEVKDWTTEGKLEPKLAEMPDIDDLIMNQYLNAAWAGQMDPMTALSAAQDKINALLNKDGVQK